MDEIPWADLWTKTINEIIVYGNYPQPLKKKILITTINEMLGLYKGEIYKPERRMPEFNYFIKTNRHRNVYYCIGTHPALNRLSPYEIIWPLLEK